MADTKTCKNCDLTKSVDDFPKGRAQCRVCVNAKAKEARDAKKETESKDSTTKEKKTSPNKTEEKKPSPSKSETEKKTSPSKTIETKSDPKADLKKKKKELNSEFTTTLKELDLNDLDLVDLEYTDRKILSIINRLSDLSITLRKVIENNE